MSLLKQKGNLGSFYYLKQTSIPGVVKHCEGTKIKNFTVQKVAEETKKRFGEILTFFANTVFSVFFPNSGSLERVDL